MPRQDFSLCLIRCQSQPFYDYFIKHNVSRSTRIITRPPVSSLATISPLYTMLPNRPIDHYMGGLPSLSKPIPYNGLRNAHKTTGAFLKPSYKPSTSTNDAFHITSCWRSYDHFRNSLVIGACAVSWHFKMASGWSQKPRGAIVGDRYMP